MAVISGRLGRALAGAAAIVAVAATLSLAPSANAVEADGPHYQEPAVGKCRNYTLTAAMKESNSTPVTACSSTHTAKVFKVAQLPASLTWSSSADQIVAAVGDVCGPAFDQALGASEKVRRMAAYTWFWFAPTQTQKEHGARWFRCDVTMWGHNSLIPLPSNANPLLRFGLKYGATRCIHGTENRYTSCSKSHHHRATGAFQYSGTTYPGDETVKRTAIRRCAPLVTSRDFMYVTPTRLSWRYGDRIAVCYSHASH